MGIYSILIVAFIVTAMVAREVYIQKKFKQLRITISTLLFIISEDPEKFEQVMQDIYNINGLEEVE